MAIELGIDDEAMDTAIAKYLRDAIKRLEESDNSLFEPGEKYKMLEAMRLTHDWFCLPSEWIVTKL